MKTTATSPAPPDDPEKENGPTNRANDKGDQVSDNTQGNDNENDVSSQTGKSDSKSSPFASNVEGQSKDGNSSDTNEAAAQEILTPSSILDMRLPASELDGVETKLVRTKITVDKPPKDQFFRVMEGSEYWIPFGILEVKRSSSFYLVAPGAVRNWMQEQDIKSFFDCVLCLVVTRHGEPRVWPLKQTDNPWHATAREIAEMAKKEWVKLISDQTAGYYVAGRASNQSKEPNWPEESFGEILEKAFAGKVIDSLDHEVIKDLNGDD